MAARRRPTRRPLRRPAVQREQLDYAALEERIAWLEENVIVRVPPNPVLKLKRRVDDR